MEQRRKGHVKVEANGRGKELLPGLITMEEWLEQDRLGVQENTRKNHKKILERKPKMEKTATKYDSLEAGLKEDLIKFVTSKKYPNKSKERPPKAFLKKEKKHRLQNITKEEFRKDLNYGNMTADERLQKMIDREKLHEMKVAEHKRKKREGRMRKLFEEVLELKRMRSLVKITKKREKKESMERMTQKIIEFEQQIKADVEIAKMGGVSSEISNNVHNISPSQQSIKTYVVAKQKPCAGRLGKLPHARDDDTFVFKDYRQDRTINKKSKPKELESRKVKKTMAQKIRELEIERKRNFEMMMKEISEIVIPPEIAERDFTSERNKFWKKPHQYGREVRRFSDAYTRFSREDARGRFEVAMAYKERCAQEVDIREAEYKKILEAGHMDVPLSDRSMLVV